MDAAFSRRRLVAPERLRALSVRSVQRGALQLGSHAGAILVTGLLIAQTWGTAWVAPALFAHGALLNFLYAGRRELSHGTMFATRRLNLLLGRITGFPPLSPRDFDTIQHWARHQRIRTWEKDDEPVREPCTLRPHLLWLLGPSSWWSRVRRILRFSAGVVTEPDVRTDQQATVIREARIHLALYAVIAAVSIASESWAAVIRWLGPMVATKLVNPLQNTIEHLGLSRGDDVLEHTRSTRTNALMRWLCWRMPHHTAHHALPSAPFRQPNRLDAEIRGAWPSRCGRWAGSNSSASLSENSRMVAANPTTR